MTTKKKMKKKMRVRHHCYCYQEKDPCQVCCSKEESIPYQEESTGCQEDYRHKEEAHSKEGSCEEGSCCKEEIDFSVVSGGLWCWVLIVFIN